MVEGRPVEETMLAAAVKDVRAAVERLPAALGETTQFEVLTVAAFLAMARAGVAAAGIEAGLGGRLDATNVLEVPSSCSPTSRSSTQTCWGRRERRSSPRRPPSSRAVTWSWVSSKVSKSARAPSARLPAPARTSSGATYVWTASPHHFAVRDASGALRAPLTAHRGRLPGGQRSISCGGHRAAARRPRCGGLREALRQTVVPGRLQVVARRPLMLADGAHNPEGVRALAASLAHVRRPSPRVGGRGHHAREGRVPEMLAAYCRSWTPSSTPRRQTREACWRLSWRPWASGWPPRERAIAGGRGLRRCP